MRFRFLHRFFVCCVSFTISFGMSTLLQKKKRFPSCSLHLSHSPRPFVRCSSLSLPSSRHFRHLVLPNLGRSLDTKGLCRPTLLFKRKRSTSASSYRTAATTAAAASAAGLCTQHRGLRLSTPPPLAVFHPEAQTRPLSHRESRESFARTDSGFAHRLGREFRYLAVC